MGGLWTVSDVRREPGDAIPPARVDALFAAHGLVPDPWFRRLEEVLGGVAFGRPPHEVMLGLRRTFHATLATDVPSTLPRTRDGRLLLRIGLHGDNQFFVALDGTAWAQDGISDRWPHRAAATLAELADALGWPLVDALLFTLTPPAGTVAGTSDATTACSADSLEP